MCAYRKEGMDEKAYSNYMISVHAPLVQNLMIKHGIDKYSLVSGSLFSGSSPIVLDHETIVPRAFLPTSYFS
jgi:hypothetical protein